MEARVSVEVGAFSARVTDIRSSSRPYFAHGPQGQLSDLARRLRLDCPSRTGGHCSSLIVPAIGNVGSDVAKGVMRNRQNRTTGTSEITP